MSFEALRNETIKRLREHRSRDKIQIGIDDSSRSESIPVALLRSSSISSQAVRAWGLLRAAGPLAYMGNSALSQYLGGAGGATNSTDELFLNCWITKEIVRDVDGSPLGTAYVLFSVRKSPEDMAKLGVRWVEFVQRLASRSGKNHARLAGVAKSILAELGIPSPESRARNPERNLIEGEGFSNNETAASGGVKNAPARERLNFSDSFGLEWQPAWERYLTEDRATKILLGQGVCDADLARRLIAEWAAAGATGFRDNDPAAALVWICTNAHKIAHTAAGDERLPAWAHP